MTRIGRVQEEAFIADRKAGSMRDEPVVKYGFHAFLAIRWWYLGDEQTGELGKFLN